MSRTETMTARAALACKTEHSPRLGQRWRLAVTASGLALTLAGCTGTPMAVTEMSAALSAELAVASAEAGAPVALSEGFASAVARAVETNAGYRAAFAQEREALSQVGVAESVRKPQLSADANLGGLQEFDSEGGMRSPACLAGSASASCSMMGVKARPRSTARQLRRLARGPSGCHRPMRWPWKVAAGPGLMSGNLTSASNFLRFRTSGDGEHGRSDGAYGGPMGFVDRAAIG